MIKVRDLTVHYKEKTTGTIHKAINHINFEVPLGTICAVLGPSGCGKSTLLKAIAGLLPPNDVFGTVSFDNAPLNPHNQCIGLMPQNYGLLPWLNVRENMQLGLKVRHAMRPDSESKRLVLAEKLGLSGLDERYPRELSGGQQQRVGLARVFLLSPDLLLMDEPFSALDAITREEMQDVFFQLWRNQRVTTLIVTHYVEEALYLGNRILLMQMGGRIQDIIENPEAGDPDLRKKEDFFRRTNALKDKIKELKYSV